MAPHAESLAEAPADEIETHSAFEPAPEPVRAPEPPPPTRPLPPRAPEREVRTLAEDAWPEFEDWSGPATDAGVAGTQRPGADERAGAGEERGARTEGPGRGPPLARGRDRPSRRARERTRPEGDRNRVRPPEPHRDREAPHVVARGPAPVPRAPHAERAPEGRSRRHGALSVLDWFSTERLEACQRAVGYYFRDMSLLENALTHSSIKSDDRPSYERMEFLGDSVIGLVVTEYLYNLLPDCDEGELTKVKSIVVSTEGLALAARTCGLDRFLAVGRGIQMKDEVPRSLIADVFEGVAGAVYLDRGYEAVRLYVLDLLRPHIEEALEDRGARNFKSVLQQVAQRDFGDTPYYDVLRESGPDHSRVYEVVAVVGKRRFGVAKAPTKKEAEQAAAKIALQSILVEKSRKSGRRRRR